MGTLIDAYSEFNWFDGLVRGHPPAIKEHPAWASAGVGADLVGMMQPLAAAGARALDATRIAEAAAVPVIAAGLLSMMTMSNLCGFGNPNNGWQFASGAKGFKKVADSLQGTKPSTSWQGTASEEYGNRNDEHQRRVVAIAETDETVQKALADEAGQVTRTRDTLDHMQTILGLAIIPAMAAYGIPPPAGEAVSMGIQVAAVTGTLPFAIESVEVLVANSARNSAAVEQAAQRYSEIASSSKL